MKRHARRPLVLLAGVLAVAAVAAAAACGGSPSPAAAGAANSTATTTNAPASSSTSSASRSSSASGTSTQRGAARGPNGFRSGNFAAVAGTLQGINGDTLTVQTSQGVQQVQVAANAPVQITATGTVADLTRGTRVTVGYQRALDGTITALSITELPTSTNPTTSGGSSSGGAPGGGGFFRRGGGGFAPGGGGGGFFRRGGDANGGAAGGGTGSGSSGAGAPLIGTIGSVSGNVVALETQQGELKLSTNNQTVIRHTSDGTVADLKTGMSVIAIGAKDSNNVVQARDVRVVPAGSISASGGNGGGFPGFPGFGGFGGGRDFGGGGNRTFGGGAPGGNAPSGSAPSTSSSG